jgi:phosphate transport system substrate-binding protein
MKKPMSRRRWTKVLLGVTAAAACALALGAAPGRADIKRSLGGHIELRGADSMLEFGQRSAEGYMVDHPEAIVTVSGGSTTRGVKSVLVGTADVALVTGQVSEELEKVASDRKIQLARRDVYRDGVLIVVHPQNPIADLPMWRLRDIFRGQVTNWKELGGKDAPIVVVNHEAHTGAFETFKRQVLGDEAVVTPRARTVPYKDYAKAVGENAIGYIGKRGLGSLKVISVDGISATPETLGSGKYPIQRRLSIVYREGAPAPVMKLVDYLLAADKGQAIVRSMGNVPVTAGLDGASAPKPPVQ